MQLDALNRLPEHAACAELLRCCGSTRWALMMAAARPFASVDAMSAIADATWWSLDRTDWLEAFAAHPRIGESSGAGGSGWSDQEQAGVRAADVRVRERLAEANRDYQARFGYIFIICATDRSGWEMLTALERRLTNEPDEELPIAAEEQRRITRCRIAKLTEP